MPAISWETTMPFHSKSNRRAAHTLVELATAMVASGFLMAGLAAVMMIGRQVAYSPTAAARRTQAADVVSHLADELRFATIIVQHVDEEDEQCLEFVVADRDTPADGAAQRIRYDWPLHPDPAERADDDPPRLYKTVNGRTWPVAEDISLQAVDDIDDIPYRLTLQPAVSPYSFAMLRLQTGVATHSRVDASIPLLTRPEKLAAYWRTNFDENPTTIDVDGSGEVDGDNLLQPDWVATNGATFLVTAGPGQLTNGTWYANGNLATNPANDFTTVTVVEARCKNMAASGNADVLQINADRQGGTYAPLIVRMQRRLDGTQTLSLLGNSTAVPLTAQAGSILSTSTVDNLVDDYVRFRLTILPAANTVILQINGTDVGTFAYVPHGPVAADRSVRIGGGAKFDYVEVRVAN
jgi:hypothetical protein